MDVLDDVRVEAWRNARADVSDKPKAKRGRPKKRTPPKDKTVTFIKNTKMALGKAREF